MDKQANREHGPYCDAISGSRESVPVQWEDARGVVADGRRAEAFG